MNVLDAYHEAAHAIMAARLNHRFENVILCNIREGSRIVTGRVVFPTEPDGLGQFLYREGPYATALIDLAGGVANKIMRPRRTYGDIYGARQPTIMHWQGTWWVSTYSMSQCTSDCHRYSGVSASPTSRGLYFRTLES